MSTDENEKRPNALRYQTFEDCIGEQPKTWLIEGVMALEEDSSWFGPPGSLKSALLTDIMVHVASGRDWRGYKFNRYSDSEPKARIEECRGVMYFALERANLTRRRLAAYATRDGLPHNLPIAIVSDTINLLDDACVDTVANAIIRFEEEAQCNVGLVIFDTFSKAVAAGDEDKAQTQNIAAANLKKIRRESYGSFHIATIGHTGKNPSAGERGSNAKLGHVDLAVQISGDKVRTATVVKGNDQPEGALASFEMQEMILGCRSYNDKGEIITGPPWTIAILAAHTPARETRTATSRPMTGKNAQALDALRRAVVERGDAGAAHADFWKEELAKAGLVRADDKNPRATFARIRKGLSQHIIEEPNGLVRINPQPGQIPPSPA